MTHPPSGPHTPTAPSGPRERRTPLDPDTAAGQAAADSLSQALAEIHVAIARRRSDRSAANAA